LITEGKLKKGKQLREINPQEMPYSLPSNWQWVYLGDVTLSSDSGWSPQCLKRPRSDNEWGVLKVSSVSWGNFNQQDRQH
jgi:type I restriction enzyme S subunit